MRIAIIEVTPQFFVDAIKGEGLQSFKVAGNRVPEDARVVDVQYIKSIDRIALVLESAAFDEAKDWRRAPVLPSPVIELVEHGIVSVEEATVTCLFVSNTGKLAVRMLTLPLPDVVDDPPVVKGAEHACRVLGIARRQFKRTTRGSASLPVYEES